jgi:hypothetical protein
MGSEGRAGRIRGIHETCEVPADPVHLVKPI